MSDTTFEALLTGRLRDYAESGVRPIDRFAIAEATIATGRTTRRWFRWPAAGRPAATLVMLGLLALALAASALLVGSRLLSPEPPLHVPRSYVDELIAGGDLSVPRLGPELVELDDGRVLVIGGNAGLETTSELFDPSTGTSTGAGPMVSAEALVPSAAVKLRDGRVLVVGDARPFAGSAFGVAQVYDPMTNRFEPAGAMVTPRASAELALLADGRVLVTGGTDPVDINTTLASAEIFDPATSTFAATGTMGTSRQFHAVAVLPDGRVLLAGGEHATGEGATMLASAEVFDPTAGTFSPAGEMTSSGGRSVAIPLDDGRVLVFQPTMDEFGEGGAQVWSPVTSTFQAARGLDGRFIGGTLLDDGRVLLTGVPDRDSTWAGVYDPVAESLADVGAPAGWQATTLRLQDGRVLLVGGLTDGNIRPENGGQLAPPVSTVEIFQ